MFFSLKDKSYLLEYAKHVITKDNDPFGVRHTTNEETPSWALSTVKFIFMYPGMLLYDPETVRQLVEFTLDRFTFNGQVQDIGLPELKGEIVQTLHEHADFLWDPEVPTDYKGLIDFQFKLISSLTIHLNIK